MDKKIFNGQEKILDEKNDENESDWSCLNKTSGVDLQLGLAQPLYLRWGSSFSGPEVFRTQVAIKEAIFNNEF